MTRLQPENEAQKSFNLTKENRQSGDQEKDEKINPFTWQEHAYERLKVLYRVGKILTSLENLDKTFPEIFSLCATTFPLLTAIVMENKSEKLSTIIWSSEIATRKQITLALNNAKESFIYLTGANPLESHDLRMSDIQSEQVKEIHTEQKNESKKNNYCVVPLLVDRLPAFGILQLEGSIRLKESDLEFVGALADLIAISVDRHHKTKIADELHKSEAIKLTHTQTYVHELEGERELRERFVSLLTHDLRTPLSAIKMTAQLIKRNNEDTETVKIYADRINNCVNRADQMISDLLDANRIRSGEKLPMKVESLNLSDLVKKTLEELTLVHGDRFILKADLTIEGYWDPSGIRRIIENLCNNAIKHGRNDSMIPISLLEKNNHAVIEVCNKGNVISHHDQKYLFQQYHRGRTTIVKGWGIGLTLVRGVAEAHGGSVKVKSEIDTGTCFSVTLPMDSRSIV